MFILGITQASSLRNEGRWSAGSVTLPWYVYSCYQVVSRRWYEWEVMYALSCHATLYLGSVGMVGGWRVGSVSGGGASSVFSLQSRLGSDQKRLFITRHADWFMS